MAEFKGLNRSVAQFRQWALADLNSPTTKGMIAEYLVRCAMGLDEAPALEWDYVDIRTSSGSIEVKSSSALSGGPTHRPVKAKFGIEIKVPWDAIANVWASHDPTRRAADVYVFCLHKETDPLQANPVDTTQWQFWIVPSTTLTAECGHTAKTVSVSRLSKIVKSVSFEDLADMVRSGLEQAISSKSES